MKNTEKHFTRKEREREFKRQEILSAAVNLFAEKGYEHTTLDEIAAASEFGKGTLYNYFQNKEEIFKAIIEGIFSDYLKLIKEYYEKTNTFKDFATLVTKYLVKYCLNNRAEFLLLARVRTEVNAGKLFMQSESINKLHEELSGYYHKIITDAIKRKEIRKVDPESLGVIYRSMIFPYIHNLMQCHKAEDINEEKETEFILSVLFEGILEK